MSVIRLSLDAELYEKLSRLAKESRRSVPGQLRWLIDEMLRRERMANLAKAARGVDAPGFKALGRGRVRLTDDG